MHCVCCDYSPYTTTDFFSGTTYDDGAKRRLYKDKRTNEFYCDVCYTAVEDTYSDFLQGDIDND